MSLLPKIGDHLFADKASAADNGDLHDLNYVFVTAIYQYPAYSSGSCVAGDAKPFYFFSGMAISFASLGCSTNAMSRVTPLVEGFFETR